MNNKGQKKFSFWDYYKKYKGRIFIDLLITVIEMFFSLFITLFFAEVMGDIATGLYIEAIRKFFIILSVQVLDQILSYLQELNYFKFEINVTREMSFAIVNQAFKVSSKAYSDHNTANFIRRIDSDPGSIISEISSIVSRVSVVINSIIIMIYTIYLNVWVGLLWIVAFIIAITIDYYKNKKNKELSKISQSNAEKYTSMLNEIVKSERDIKSINLENQLESGVKKSYNVYQKSRLKNNVVYSSISRIKWLIVQTLVTLMAILGIKLMDMGLLTFVSFIVIYNNRSRVQNLSYNLAEITRGITRIKLATERINELYEDDEYELEKFGNTYLDKVKGKIEFKNVNYSYITYKERDEAQIKADKKANKRNHINAKVPTREVTGKNKVFENLSFKITPNTTVAFVGKSGSGKSTILNLLSKLYDVDGGEILIDGVNINDLDKKTIRSSISLVNQFPYIFDMSIKENLLLAKPNATDSEINDALKNSALDDFVATLPDGVNTRVGESGIKLSGGQRQRLAIARALLKNSSIIIFDESTSSLDNFAQNKVKESIDNIKGKSTVVIVAHRLTTIKNVDKIFFLDNGEIVDEGSFDELYNRNETFKTMFLAENLNLE